jgi:hypothetical protein
VKKEGPSFLKKSGKKLLLIWAWGAGNARDKEESKVFCCFFSKKKFLLHPIAVGFHGCR